MPALAEWDSFYIIVGPAAGALIGLQFVIMTLMADRPARISADAGRSFATPTVVHFCAVLLVAALARVPWPLATLATGSAGAAGVAGLVYMIAIVVRMRRQSDYTMDGEDRFFHVVLPFIGYGVLVASSVVALAHFELALFGIGLGLAHPPVRRHPQCLGCHRLAGAGPARQGQRSGGEILISQSRPRSGCPRCPS